MNDRLLASYVYWYEDADGRPEFLCLGLAWMTPEMDAAREDFITAWKAERGIK